MSDIVFKGGEGVCVALLRFVSKLIPYGGEMG